MNEDQQFKHLIKGTNSARNTIMKFPIIIHNSSYHPYTFVSLDEVVSHETIVLWCHCFNVEVMYTCDPFAF